MGTAVMQAKKQFIPISKVFSWIKLPVPNFTQASASFYKGHAKALQCLPFSCATVVLFYNKTLLDNIGATPPETFEDFQEMAIKYRKEGALLTLAAGWLSGHHMDQIGAIHNIPIATKGNGIDGRNTKLLDNPFFNTHWMFLQAWHKAGLFSLKTGPEAEKAFATGEVTLISQGANREEIIKKAVDGRFEIGVAHFPYWRSVGKPGKTIAGGSAFWVSKKKYSAKKKIAIAKLLAFLSDTKTQSLWQEKTGYIPVVVVPKNDKISHAAKLAEEAFSRSEPMTYNRGIMLPNYPKIRDLIVKEMTDFIKSDRKDAKETMKNIVEQGNELLKKAP